MPPKRHLSIVPTTPEHDPTSRVIPGKDQFDIERAAVSLAGVALARVKYSGDFEGETDNLAAYFTEISQYPLLKSNEEVTHALSIKAGKKAKAEIDSGAYEDGFIGPVELTKHQAELSVMEGQVASSIMITCNLRLVAKISGLLRFQNRGLSRLDLIQEGYFGLAKAVGRFDADQGNKFSTFATPHIVGAINKGLLYQGRTIRVPVHRHDEILTMNIARTNLRNQLKREPTTEEIGIEIDRKPKFVEKLRLDESIQHTATVAKISEYDGEEYGSDKILSDESAQIPFDRITDDMTIRNLLENLTDRQLRYVQLRYGLLDGNARTQDEVGQIMGFTRANASLIEKKVISHLRKLIGRE